MYRLIVLTLFLMLVYYLIRKAVLKQKGTGGWLSPERGRDGGNQMVQDPVCRVFVPRANAVQEDIGGQTYFFCSAGCAKAFQKQLSN
jgi:YHS domain-containing protein